MIQETYTAGQFWFNFLLMNFIFIGAYECFKKRLNSQLIWGSIFAFCVLSYWNQDYFTFHHIYIYELDLTFRDPLYYYIKQITFGSYHLFRAIIWGGALFLFYKTSKKIGIPPWIVIYVFPICFLLTFSYARASLAMACYFWGVTLLNKSKKISLVGIFFIVFSYFAHRSMLPLILFTPLAVMRLKMTNKFHLLITIVIPILVTFSFINLMQESVMEQIQAPSGFEVSANKYLREAYSDREVNLRTKIISSLHFTAIYLLYVYLLYKISWVKAFAVRKDKQLNCMMLISTFLIVVSILFFYLSYSRGYPNTLAYRYLFISYIPLILMVSQFYQKGICRKRTLYWLMLPSFLYAEGLIGGILYSRFL